MEETEGNSVAAAETRVQAVDAYLSYRRDGGEAHTLVGALCDTVEEAVLAGAAASKAAALQLAELQRDPDSSDSLRTLLLKLETILNGSRDLALADAPILDYDDAAELLLLLENLSNTTTEKTS
ncbi:MAG: hypothetical protein GY862_35920 [Gammaproteobacteria bacterium]|nr:hypothetical protein [Gammaproteobacteria bacterium]